MAHGDGTHVLLVRIMLNLFSQFVHGMRHQQPLSVSCARSFGLVLLIHSGLRVFALVWFGLVGQFGPI